MLEVSNADRVVFPAIGRTKGDVVAYYDALAARILPHVALRPLSIRRFPKGLAAPGFFQKNVPPHYPESIARFAVPRSTTATKKHRAKPGAKEVTEETIYPILSLREHLPYLANQGAIELHVPSHRAELAPRPDRIVIDLDPPAESASRTAKARRAALLVREALASHGLESVPIATGSKGYHVVATITPELPSEAMMVTLQRFAALLSAKHPDEMTIAFRVGARGERVFVDWLRNAPFATVVVPWSLRARPNATVATPLAWGELETTAPDAFTIDDRERLLERPDTVAALAPGDGANFARSVEAAFEASGLVLQKFDRFRS